MNNEEIAENAQDAQDLDLTDLSGLTQSSPCAAAIEKIASVDIKPCLTPIVICQVAGLYQERAAAVKLAGAADPIRQNSNFVDEI